MMTSSKFAILDRVIACVLLRIVVKSLFLSFFITGKKDISPELTAQDGCTLKSELALMLKISINCLTAFVFEQKIISVFGTEKFSYIPCSVSILKYNILVFILFRQET